MTTMMQPPEFTGELTALEVRADVPSLEALHVQRRQLLPQYAMLKALHGVNGKFDNSRKALLEALKIRHRLEAVARGEKVTEGYVDALAHGDHQYVAFIDQGIADAARFAELEIYVAEIEERIRNREVSLLCYNSEVKLSR